jgi:hypothetical protein
MTTMTTQQTQAFVFAVTGTDVRDVAANCWQEIIDIHNFYGRDFPYDKQKLRNDIGQLLLWDMTDAISVQFFELVNGEKVERLSYNYLPVTDPQAVNSPPGEYPRYTISPDWKVRITARYNPHKPEPEVREFFDAIGWRPSEPLTRTGAGKMQEHGVIKSRNYGVKRAVYTDLPDTTKNDSKEREL